MTEGYGRQVGTALRAVLQLHSDTSRLLVDCDRIFEGESIFGNYATRELTYNVSARSWMAGGVYRFYRDPSDPQIVWGVTVCFIDNDNVKKPPEPTLIVGRIEYAMTDNEPADCNCWDLWNQYDKSDGFEGVQMISDPYDDQRIERIWLQAGPLYSVNSIEDIEGMKKEIDPKASGAC